MVNLAGCTSEIRIVADIFFFFKMYKLFSLPCRGMYFGLYDTLKPLLLGADAGVALSFALGWAVTITAGLMSYPIGECVVRRFFACVVADFLLIFLKDLWEVL